jgi:hypothetical protein
MEFTVERPLRLTTIDSRETWAPEDGFAAIPKEGTLYFASVVPPLEKANFDLIRSMFRQRRAQSGRSLFAKKHTLGISKDHLSKGIIMTVTKPFDTCILTYGIIKGRRTLTHHQAKIILLESKDQELNMLQDYCMGYNQSAFSPSTYVETVLEIFNAAAEDAMREHGLPFLGTEVKYGPILISHGRCVVNKPLRNIVALVNCLQLSHYLEHEDELFPEKFLIDLLY